jgi:hypothetical protein
MGDNCACWTSEYGCARRIDGMAPSIAPSACFDIPPGYDWWPERMALVQQAISGPVEHFSHKWTRPPNAEVAPPVLRTDQLNSKFRRDKFKAPGER